MTNFCSLYIGELLFCYFTHIHQQYSSSLYFSPTRVQRWFSRVFNMNPWRRNNLNIPYRGDTCSEADLHNLHFVGFYCHPFDEMGAYSSASFLFHPCPCSPTPHSSCKTSYNNNSHWHFFFNLNNTTLDKINKILSPKG